MSSCGAPVANNAQPPLDMVKEIRNRIQLIGARGKGAKDGKVNKDDCQEDGDNVNCILKEGGGGGVRQGHSASLC